MCTDVHECTLVHGDVLAWPGRFQSGSAFIRELAAFSNRWLIFRSLVSCSCESCICGLLLDLSSACLLVLTRACLTNWLTLLSCVWLWLFTDHAYIRPLLVPDLGSKLATAVTSTLPETCYILQVPPVCSYCFSVSAVYMDVSPDRSLVRTSLQVVPAGDP